MAESRTISGLVAKRSELDGIIQFHCNEIQRLSGDVGHLDAAIKLFDPDLDLRILVCVYYTHNIMYLNYKNKYLCS